MEVKELEEKPAAQLATDLSVPAGGIKMVAPGETQRFPAFLPMQHPYEREKFFVRECYPIYYDLIMDKLYTKDKRCVVITGAPGTGKSLFYAYFFERFRQEEERQNFTIVTAAFASESKLTKVVAFKGKQNEPIGTSEWPLSSEFNESIWQVDGANTIRLYDGPPFVETPYPLKMVCFTSPKENWLYRFVKDTTVRTLCMPVWTPDELWRAATRLGYNSLSPPLTRAMIDDRFTNFGGVARECLELTEEVVQTRLELFEAVIKEMSPEVATIMLKGDSAYNGRPRLCHLVPVRDDPWHFEVQIASEGISLKLLEKISTAEFEDRSKLIRCLRGISEEAASRGYLFELKVHELLVRGISIDTILLRDGRGDQQPIRQITFHCEKSNDFNFFEPKTLSKATLSSGPYHIPGNPVSGKGIVAVLKSLELLENAVRHPSSVVLIFVTPQEEESRLEHTQNIPWDTEANAESVDTVPGVGDVQRRKLETIEIRTVGDLRKVVHPQTPKQWESFTTHKLKPYKTILSKFDRRQESIGTMLQKIPQYVWEMA